MGTKYGKEEGVDILVMWETGKQLVYIKLLRGLGLFLFLSLWFYGIMCVGRGDGERVGEILEANGVEMNYCVSLPSLYTLVVRDMVAKLWV